MNPYDKETIRIESEALYELIDELAERLLEKHSAPPEKRWISGEDVMDLLNISSKSTLQKLRDEGKIRFTQPEKKILLYDRESVNEYLEAFAHDTF